jgi:hypothetical protein
MDPKLFLIERIVLSGLSEDSVAALGLKPFHPHEAPQYGVADSRMGFAIPYFDRHGQATGYHRLRFKTVADNAPKYLQPASSLPYIYFPPNLDGGSWAEYLDHEHLLRPITITEGELKAAKATQEKVATIALGGVWSFRGVVEGLLPDLEAIEWKGRQVELVFDSDLADNRHVQRALFELATRLIERGAKVCRVDLPSPGGEKVGLDDYLRDHGVDAYRALAREPASALHAKLMEYGQRYAVLRRKGAYHMIDLTHDDPESTAVSITEWANRGPCSLDKITVTHADGSTKPISPAKMYTQWPQRMDLDGTSYAPGRERIFDSYLNTWKGWGLEPWPDEVKPEEVRAWLELLELVFDGDADKVRWFQQWLAYPLQNPGAKMNLAFVMWGPKGVGKSSIADIMSKIYGEANVASPNQHGLASRFNGWVTKQFVIADDKASGGSSDSRDIAALVRNFVTADMVDHERKGHDIVRVKCHANMFVTSNHIAAIKIEQDERRFAVHRITNEKRENDFYHVELCPSYIWGYDQDRNEVELDGARRVFRWLRDFEMDGFNPHASAPSMWEHDLDDAVSATSDDLTRWLLDDVAPEPELMFAARNAGECELATPDQVQQWFSEDDTAPARARITFVNKTLFENPKIAVECCSRLPGRTKQKRRVQMTDKRGKTKLYRVWAFKNHEKWAKAEAEEVREHWESYFGPVEKGAEL